MIKFARVMEIFWLVLTVLTAVWAGYSMVTAGWDASKILLWFPLLCLAMYLYRRFTTQKMKAWLEREEQERARKA